MNTNYIVAGIKPWNKRIFENRIRLFKGNWHFIDKKEQLTYTHLKVIAPRYIFFLHWSWMIPEEIVNEFECVCFHMTDVPFGRGGSPLQNLIVRGYKKTKMSALRMVNELDAGPVYLKEDLSLEGNAEEIYIRATNVSADMIRRMIEEQPQPVDQSGEVVIFKRRKPEQSEIPDLDSLAALHDFIRMLDAEGYPKAFLAYKDFKLEFDRANLYDGKIIANVQITVEKEKNK